MSSAIAPMSRRWAAGIDIGSDEIRLVIVSKRGRHMPPVRVEHLAAAPLAAGVMSKPGGVDQGAVIDALTELIAQAPGVSNKLSCAMAVPGIATVATSVALPQLMPRAAPIHLNHTLDALELAVFAHAERMAGVERHALAVDWFIDEHDRAGSPPYVTIVATLKQHLEARLEIAAAAGIVLSVLDGEPPAALRGLRHAAELDLESHERYAAIWIGDDGLYGWRIAGGKIEAYIRYPAPEHEDLASALRALVNNATPGCAWVGGRLGAGLTLADISDLLMCPVLPFECAPFCDDCEECDDCDDCDDCDQANTIPRELHHAPAFALAFGLALRGVCE